MNFNFTQHTKYSGDVFLLVNYINSLPIFFLILKIIKNKTYLQTRLPWLESQFRTSLNNDFEPRNLVPELTSKVYFPLSHVYVKPSF